MHHINVDAFLAELKLGEGGHSKDQGFCVMEAAAYIAGEPWSDHPKCVSPVIAAFLRNWNDCLDNETRQRLKPYVTKSLNTVGTDDDEERRAWMATDWLARECAPAFLRLAGLTVHAETLEKLGALTGTREAVSAQPSLAAAGAAARAAARDAARAAARDAAWDAARAAAWDAAGAAARDAARAAARDAAWAAAGAAAWDAAGAAAKKKLEPTVKALQVSAFNLVDRMIAVTAKEEDRPNG